MINNLQENVIIRILNRIFDLIILNVLCLITSLPIITAGASLTALYSVTIRMVARDEGYIVRDYFRAFKKNLGKGIAEFIIVAVVQAVIIADILIILHISDPLIRTAMSVLAVIAEVFWLMITIFVFPVTAFSDANVRENFIQAVTVPISSLPETAVVMLITSAVMALTFLSRTTIMFGAVIWVLIGVSGVAFADSGLIRRILKPHFTI